MSESFPPVLSSFDIEQHQTWSLLFEMMSTTLKESWGIALYSSIPARYIIDRKDLYEHWSRQTENVTLFLESVGEVNPIYWVNDEDLIEPHRLLQEILKCELSFQSKLQQQVDAVMTGASGGLEEFAFFAALLEYLHRTQAAITVRMHKVREEINRLQAAISERPVAPSLEVVAA